LSRNINAWEFRWPLNTYARDLGEEGLSEIMRGRLKEAEAMTLEEYQGFLDERTRCREIYAKIASLADACITLAASGPAPVGISSTGDPTFAIPGSLLGVPALSLPLLQVGGLPLGLQLLGFREKDAELFGFAAVLLNKI
jgi:Asp-tRNA(Asn)/Glu-tRNA(Gln) amidotransferase A subunit family amidase